MCFPDRASEPGHAADSRSMPRRLLGASFHDRRSRAATRTLDFVVRFAQNVANNTAPA